MPVYIQDPTSLRKIAAVEGDAWMQSQFSGAAVSVRYGWVGAFAAFAAKATAAQIDPEYAHDAVDNFFDGWAGVIYGAGGYNRYFVRPDGEIIFDSYFSVSEARTQKARAEDFTVR